MTKTVNAKFCDLCLSDNENNLADGTYTTDEGRTFDGCEAHLEEVEGYGFTTTRFAAPGDIRE